MRDSARGAILTGLLAACLSYACHKTVRPPSAEGRGPGYVWVQLPDGSYALGAAGDEGLKAGLAELCQTSPCSIEHVGTLEIVRVEVLHE